MQVQLFDIFDESAKGPQPDRVLSFGRFLAHLTQLSNNRPSRKDVLAFVLSRFQQALAKYGSVNAGNIANFAEELYYLYNLSIPLLTNEGNALWGLAFPMSGRIFYGTDAFYQFIKREHLSENVIDKLESINGNAGSLMVYQLIFERLYGFSNIGTPRLVYAVNDDSGSLPRYYAIKMDNSYVEVTPKGSLPKVNYKALKGKKMNEISEQDLARVVALDNFQIEGFSIISLEDITHEYVIEELTRISMRGGEYDHEPRQKTIENNLRLLTGICNLHTWVTPILKLNDKPLLRQDLFGDSLLYSQIIAKVGEKRLLDYLLNPYVATFQIDTGLPGMPSFFDPIAVDLELGSLAVIPLFHNRQAVGLLELYTEKGVTITGNALAHLRPVVPLLTQFVNDIGLDFKARLDAIILDRFTALQPAVHWKFNEAAWTYLCTTEHSNPAEPAGESMVGQQIRFEHVYPLYGAVDIRNSTTKRNEALLADMTWQLELLRDTLLQIDRHHAVPQHLLQRTEELKKRLDAKQVDYVQSALPVFVNEEVKVAFSILKKTDESLTAIIHAYEQQVDEAQGDLNPHKQAFESAVEAVNTIINDQLDIFNHQVQAVYPSYFERFRTDGVEFDCYVGQSISPHIPFEQGLLKQIKRLQLVVMAAIAKDTQTLALQSSIALETTQLIFINNSEIDISFREDERRFDVEGTYNIRYQVIKKRIDKAVIKGSAERVTQPGKITLIYLHEETLYDYLTYIEELQHSGVLEAEIEHLELEALQGVSGLRALRVTVAI
ncbi:hypothetical protein [Parapedobacter defluvii]|uniref:hypothetical protein n=1 Tax=Parapedobacter defluvii TaxID=2045106 RepID=UPI00333F05FB